MDALSFPRLKSQYRVTSAPTSNYNCVAWAAGDTSRWWWPEGLAYWPPGVPRQRTVEAFVAAYRTMGFAICADGSHELGFEKVAIYADSRGEPQHAARQLETGLWTSKLGAEADIEHPDPDALAGGVYGAPVLYMRRQLVGI